MPITSTRLLRACGWIAAHLVATGCGPLAEPTDPAADPPSLGGAAAVSRRGCPSCHDPGDGTLSGQDTPRPGTSSYGANLTPDPDTGLGGWSDVEILRALRLGVDDQNVPLCATMPHLDDLGDHEAAQILAFLRQLRPIVHRVPASTCGDAPRADCAPDAGVPLDGTVVDGLELADARSRVSDLAGPRPADLALLPDPPDAGSVESGASDGGGSPAADGGFEDGAIRCAPVINEIQTAGPGGAEDEFIELYNPCPGASALSGFALAYRSSSGVKDVGLLHFDAIAIPARGFLVCGQEHYGGVADLRYREQIAGSGGGLALRDSNGATVDEVGWGDATNQFVTGHAATAPDPGRSIGRIPDGQRSGNDAVDFAALAEPTPGAPNR